MYDKTICIIQKNLANVLGLVLIENHFERTIYSNRNVPGTLLMAIDETL